MVCVCIDDSAALLSSAKKNCQKIQYSVQTTVTVQPFKKHFRQFDFSEQIAPSCGPYISQGKVVYGADKV